MSYRYDEIRHLYVEQLAFTWMMDSMKVARASFQKIKNYAKGDSEHAAEMLSELWEIASRDEDPTAPAGANPVQVVSLFEFSPFEVSV